MRPMQVDSGKAIVDNIVQIGDVNVVVKETCKRPMVFSKSVKSAA